MTAHTGIAEGGSSDTTARAVPAIPTVAVRVRIRGADVHRGPVGRTGSTDVDVTITCGYPFTNLLLTRADTARARPAHVFVTRKGDYPATSYRAEYRYFRCDGLVCTNPEYEARNRHQWRTALIGNGVDVGLFAPGPSRRAASGSPSRRRSY